MRASRPFCSLPLLDLSLCLSLSLSLAGGLVSGASGLHIILPASCTSIQMPRCACASEVYASVSVCVSLVCIKYVVFCGLPGGPRGDECACALDPQE